ncbi:MAG: 4-hydroxy-tetrahydrodipicolinate reductase, partial [Clostridiales bacterium]|nr:4-hydroxy-tetrahydrodipicolinate reductase [Clostridiales bacterium]
FYSGNMSLRINLLIELAKKAAKVLGNDFDIEIIEKHHNLKVDAPSGTALMIADEISGVLDNEPQYVYDRHSYRKKRADNEIGIHSDRGGNIDGEQEDIMADHDEVVTEAHP